MAERHDVAQAILDLSELGAPIKRASILKALNLGISTKAAKAVDGIIQEMQGSGLLTGEPRKGMVLAKGAVAGLRSMLLTEPEWIAEAKALIEGFGHHLADHIDLESELKEQPGWFREARLPWLQDHRFYLRGINRNGDRRETQPMNGWVTGTVPDDYCPPRV
jgi:hypothetical protein